MLVGLAALLVAQDLRGVAAHHVLAEVDARDVRRAGPSVDRLHAVCHVVGEVDGHAAEDENAYPMT